jgi:hypothetical protein
MRRGLAAHDEQCRHVHSLAGEKSPGASTVNNRPGHRPDTTKGTAMTDEKKQQSDLDKILFMNLVMMLASSAMQQMGKLVNPMTQKMEVNLEGAQVTIDLLTMIQTKTRGNLDAEEAKMLKDLLSSLQLNYVEMTEAAKDEKKAPAADVPPQASEAKEDPASNPTDAETKKDPKFRKSYGS